MKTISKILSVVLCLSMVIGLFVVGASAATGTVTKVSADLGYENAEDVVSVDFDGIATMTFDVGSNSYGNTPKYYNSGAAIRAYTGNTITFTPASGVTITSIKITAVSGSYAVDSDVTIDNGSVSVSDKVSTITPANGANAIVLTNTRPSNGQIRMVSVEISYSTSGSVTPPPATEETTPATEETTPATEETTPVTPPASGDTVTIVSANLGYENGTDVTSVDFGGKATMTLEVGSNSYGNTPKYYTSGTAIRAYTGNIITFTPAAGVSIASIKITAADEYQGKTYVIDSDVTFVNGSVTVDGNVSTIVPVDGSSAIVLTNTRPSNGQIRMVSIEITFGTGSGSVTPPATEETTPSEPATEATTPSEPATEATKPSTTLAPVAKPVAGTAYKFALVQANLGKTLYFNGKMDESGKYFGTSENAAEAVDVYLEAAQGGYYFYFMDGNTKTYLSLEGYIDSKGNQKAAVKLTTEATTVFTYSEEAKTFIHTIGDTSFYLGTYGTYNTMSASSTYYITGDKAADVGVSQFVSTFYAPAGGSSNTGDTSVISVAAAALVLSVLGGTALIIKKKEN